MPGPVQGAGANAGAFRTADQQQAILESLQNRPKQGSSAYDALNAALLVSFPGEAPETIHLWTQELLTRVRPPELDLRIAVNIGPHHEIEKNKAFAHCVQQMGVAAWRALQNHAAQANGFGVTVVSIGRSVDVNSTVAEGLAQLNAEVLNLDREISESLVKRLKQAGVRAIPRRTRAPEPVPKARRRQSEDYRRLKAERDEIRTARLDFAHAKLQTAADAQAVTRNLIAIAHAKSSKIDERPVMKKLAAVIAGGKRPAVRGIVRAVVAREAPLHDPRRVDLLMARGPSEAVAARAQSPTATTEMKTPKLLGDMLNAEQRSHLDKHAAARKKVFVPELSAFVEADEMSEAEEVEAAAALEPPLLHRMCGDLPPNSFGQFEAMGAYVEEILKSELPMEDKDALCVSAHAGAQGEVSAAQWALQKGSPGAAAAILLAVLESGAGAQTIDRIMSKLGVTSQEVIAALREGFFREQPWCRDAIRRLEAASKGLVLARGTGAVKLDHGSKDALRAHRMWNETGKVLCTAGREIESLRFHQPTGRDRDALQSTGPHVYLLDPDMLTRA